MAMDENTRQKLKEFSARFQAQRHEAEKRKEEDKKAKRDTAERKAENKWFHERNKLLPGGVPVSSHEDENRLSMLRKADDLNWLPQAVLVTGQWQVCRCCSNEAIATSGMYFREKHKTIPSAKRLREIKTLPEGFPVEVAIEGVVLQECIKCLNGTLVDDILSTLLHGGELRLSNQMDLFKKEG